MAIKGWGCSATGKTRGYKKKIFGIPISSAIGKSPKHPILLLLRRPTGWMGKKP